MLGKCCPLGFPFVMFYFFITSELIVCVPFPFGVWSRMWNSNVSVPDHCLYLLFNKTEFDILILCLISLLPGESFSELNGLSSIRYQML